MPRNVVNGIFIPVAVKDLSEKIRALSDSEGVKLTVVAKFVTMMTVWNMFVSRSEDMDFMWNIKAFKIVVKATK